MHGDPGEPQLRNANLLLELEVAAGPRLGHQQQVVEEKQVALLALHSL